MNLKRGCAVFLCLILILSVIPSSTLAAVEPIPTTTITTTPTGYTKASDVKYVTSGNYIANWGARGEVCEFLSPYAQQFYLNTTYASLSQLSGGTGKDDAPNSALYAALQKLMKDNHTYETSYDATRNLYKYTDCVSSNYSQLSTFYTGKLVNSTWDSGATYNREHTWPNSKGLDGNDENDIMMLRPELSSNNSSRGNSAYGTGSGYYDPGVSVRGDVARIFLYIYVRWGNTNGNSTYKTVWGTQGVIQDLDTLLYWMEADPVDTWEMGRNDAVESITGTRNVFVDYPELAWKLFGKEVPASATTPSQKGDGTIVLPPQPTYDSYAKQADTIAAGDKVYIYSVSGKEVLTASASGSRLAGASTTVSNSRLGVTGDMVLLTVGKNASGYYTFQSPDGKYLTSGSTGNSLSFTATANEYSLWTLQSVSGGWQIANVNAKYNGNVQALEYYNSSFTTYGVQSGSSAYTFLFFKPDSQSTDPVNPPAPTQPQPTQPKPTQPQPTQPKPTQPQPTQPKPTQPPVSEPTVPVTDPTDPQPTEPQPTDPQPTDPEPTDPQPTDPEPTDPKSTEPEPTQPAQPGKTNSFPVGGIIAIVVAVLAAGGAAAWYFLIYRKKQKLD